ncbi:MAG TPA: dihydropyrimidinase [Mycobacterium sp.]|nr:dihydropyrimidinase [Mycobacterium sp.]
MTASERPVDLLVRGGTVVTEDGQTVANVAIRDESIVAISPGEPRASRVIDAEGLLVLPGGIDAHTHLNSQWPFPDERRPADDFASGSRGAAAGGITTVCDFVYALGDETLGEALQRVTADARRSHVDVALHMVIMNLRDGYLAEVDELVTAGCPSFKFYTSDPSYIANRGAYLRVLERIGQAGGVAMFHCEDPAIVEHRRAAVLAAGHVSPSFYAQTKPVEAELSATVDALSMASVAGVPCYVVHLSAGPVLDTAIAARERGASVHVETRPLYLYLTDDRFEADDATAARYIGTPPLRSDTDRERLWRGIAAGEIDVVASDHVGFTGAQKYTAGDTFDTVPKGVANTESLLPMLYSEGVRTGRVTLEQFVGLVATNPARIFGVYPRKGTIAIGSDADLCILDPNDRRTLSGASLHSAADLEVFDGWEVVGWPAYTISRGDVIVEHGKVVGGANRGRFIAGRPR